MAAGSANAVTVRPSIIELILVSMWAVCAASVACSDGMPGVHVRAMVYYAQMFWINTVLSLTLMVHFQLWRYWTYKSFVSKSVRIDPLGNSCDLPDEYDGVSRADLAAGPFPASRVPADRN